jgi:type IX secretion system PorP/SprF family membrane protein
MKKVITCGVLLVLLFATTVKSQQLPIFSQYLFNGFLINPAYAGIDGLTTVSLVSREQWVGLPNAPTTQMVSYQTRLLPESFVGQNAAVRQRLMSRFTDGRVGLGVTVFNDETGIIMRNGANLTYAYHLPLEQGELISMALTGSFSQFSIDKSRLQLANPVDGVIEKYSLNMFMPDMGAGIVYSNKSFYAGLSVDQLFQAYLKFGPAQDAQYQLYQEINLTGAYRLELDDQGTIFEPNILIKTTAVTWATQMDLTGKVHFPNDFWLGLSYRTGSAIVFMTGIVLDQFTVGYSFDYNLGNLGGQTYGTHEFMVAYKFGNTPSRLRWLNR